MLAPMAQEKHINWGGIGIRIQDIGPTKGPSELGNDRWGIIQVVLDNSVAFYSLYRLRLSAKKQTI